MRGLIYTKDADGREADGREACLGEACLDEAVFEITHQAKRAGYRPEAAQYQPKLNIPLTRAIRNAAYVRSLSPEDQKIYWLQHQQNLAEAQQTRIGGSW